MSQATTTPAKHPIRPVIRIVGRPGANDRAPLPAGHPITWRILTDDTPLAGEPYPLPVFDWS